MIKNRRKNVTPKAAARKASTADKAVAKGRAARQAGANARRGLREDNKPSAMEVEREINRQVKMSSSNRAGGEKKETGPKMAQRPPHVNGGKGKNAAGKQKAKQDGQKQASDTPLPPTWIGGTRRPPSVKAVTAAITAMQENGFKVPKGMQMVISFAPAPDSYPATTLANTTPNKVNTQPNNSSKKGSNGQGNKQPQQAKESQDGSGKKNRNRRNRPKK